MATVKNSKKSGRAGAVVEDATLEKTKSRKQQIRDLLSKMKKSLNGKAANATVADFVRLTQLERELERDEPPRKVVITWRESPEIQHFEK
jgi:hypothetical protein